MLLFFILDNEIVYTFSFPQMWINPCAQVIFDSDPAPKDMSGPAGVEVMSQAMIRCLQNLSCVYQKCCLCININFHVCFLQCRGMMDEEGNQFVAYFLPNEDTLRKRKRDVEEGLDYMPEDLWVKTTMSRK